MRDWRIVAGVAATTGVAIGLALASMLEGDARQGMPAGAAVAPPANSKVPAGRDSEWASLRDELAHEREARLLLVEEIDLLWEELELIAQNAEPAAPIADPTVPDNNASKQTEARRQFDDTRLAKAGLETDEIERLRENYEAMELDELYLRDQAVREGWLNGSRYRRELRDLKEQLREDLGEEDYDRMLFATGQKNRVRASSGTHPRPMPVCSPETSSFAMRTSGFSIHARCAPGPLMAPMARLSGSKSSAMVKSSP